MQYEAPGWGVGELWLRRGSVLHSELPRARPARTLTRAPDAEPGRTLVQRLCAFFAGEDEDFARVRLVLPEGFYGDCARALRGVGRGEVVTYGELARLAGYPGAARAAGTFCGRCALSPFVPTHRVVAAGGLGSYGDLGSAYKRRLLALEGVEL